MLRTVLAILFISNSAFAKDTLMPVIFLDDIVISEENNGFTVEDFVRYVKNDTTFYMGFKHLRYYTHDFTSELLIFNKKGKVKSSIKLLFLGFSLDVTDSFFKSCLLSSISSKTC